MKQPRGREPLPGEAADVGSGSVNHTPSPGGAGALNDQEDTQILLEAKERFKRIRDFESDWRTRAILDMKFEMGDSENGWQWPDDIKKGRDANKRPSLTINKTAATTRQIVNRGRENRPGLKISAVGEQATLKAARVYMGLFRDIENQSNANAIYDFALRDAVSCGAGFWRVQTSYFDDESFDQEIRMMPVEDVLSVLLDENCKQVDGSDAMYGFVYNDLPRKEFERQNPDLPIPQGVSQQSGIDESDDWVTTDNVRIAEYYRIVTEEDELIELTEPSGQWTGRASEITAEFYDDIMAKKDLPDVIVKQRPIKNHRLEWFKIMGYKIVDRRTKKNKPMRGKYIPLIRVLGRQRVVEGRLERKGLVRDLKDPQRMYNYNSSGEVETVALQTKTPWVIPAEAIEGNEVAWNNANTQNAAALIWKAFTADMQVIPKPERINPPTESQAFLSGMQVAAAEFEMASGMAQAQQQNPMLERTPRAIDERIYKGEVACQDFYENMGLAICQTARIIIDLAPHIYDTQRIVKILADDGTFQDITIDPQMDEAHREQKEKEGDQVKVFFNPSVGRYAVVVDVGPSYETKRKEAWNAFSQILMANEQLTGLIGDIAFRNADFEGAEQIADRMKKALMAAQPNLFDNTNTVGPPAQVMELQQTIQKITKDNADLLEKFTAERMKNKGKDELRDIEWEDVKTRRLAAEGNVTTDILALENSGSLHKLLEASIKKTLVSMGIATPEDIEAADQEADDDREEQAKAEAKAAKASAGTSKPKKKSVSKAK